MTWRDDCRPIIAKVLAENRLKSEKEIKKALYDAYPYGERKYHPYKIWLDEIKIQTGKKISKREIPNENQINLFEP